jgi:hypothetical protein
VAGGRVRLGGVCVDPTQVCVNTTQVCVIPTQVRVNPTQVCVNPTLVYVHPGGPAHQRRHHGIPLGRVEGPHDRLQVRHTLAFVCR